MFSEKLLIDGKLVDGDHKLDVINPSTGEVFITVARASEAQLDQAVAAARRAQPAWAALDGEARAACIRQLVGRIHDNAEALSRAIALEVGRPLPHCAGEVAMTEAFLSYFADNGLSPEVLQDDASFDIEAIYTPLGVVAGITPWNFPIAAGVAKAASAMLLGNSFIWKVAPTTPVSALLVAKLASDIFPAGVFNVLVDNNDLGAKISAHSGINKISFTGSTATGKKVMESAASLLKRITLELGGNDAAIVLDDVDVEKVAPQIFAYAFANSGQVCIAIKRVYAHASVYDRLCEELAKLAKGTVVGDATEQGVQMGPVQNAAQFAKAKEFLASANQDGTVIAGGNVLDRPGYFIAPTIVKDVPEDARIVREEQFAPILPVNSFDDVGDAIARANDTSFGLGGSVWSSDVERAKKVARQIDAGSVWINQHMALLPSVPFGGAKQSGFGVEMGREGLAEFAQRKVINAAKG